MPKKQPEVRVISTPPEGYEITNPVVLALIVEGFRRLQAKAETNVNAG